MATMTHVQALPHGPMRESAAAALRRTLVIGLIAFLTLIDLFAAEAILPSLVVVFGVTPAAMGVAVNASTPPSFGILWSMPPPISEISRV